MPTMTPKQIALGVSLASGLLLGGLAQAETMLRTVGNFSGNKLHVEQVERPFFNELNARDDLAVVYNPMDAIGVEAGNAGLIPEDIAPNVRLQTQEAPLIRVVHVSS